MKKIILAVSALLLVLALMPSQTSAFQLTASDMSGYVAYDRDHDVVNRYSLDPRLSYENTGRHFNVAAGITFGFDYNPSYPSAYDVIGNPTMDWRWTLESKNLRIVNSPYSLPDITLSHTGSYADLLAGVDWASDQLDRWNIEGCYFLDYEMTSETSGVATLSLGAWVNDCLIPGCLPNHFIAAGAMNGDLSLTTEPVPEPATMLLFSGGLAGVAAWRRRRQLSKKARA